MFKKFAIVAVTIIVCLVAMVSSQPASGESSDVDSSSAAFLNEASSQTSDGQIQHKPLQELANKRKSETGQSTMEPEVKGLAAPLDILLGRLSNESKQSGNQLQYLLDGIPNLFPDLYKVFVSL